MLLSIFWIKPSFLITRATSTESSISIVNLFDNSFGFISNSYVPLYPESNVVITSSVSVLTIFILPATWKPLAIKLPWTVTCVTPFLSQESKFP